MTRRRTVTPPPMDQGPSTLKPMAGTTSRATRSSGRQAPDSLAGDTSCEHAEQGPANSDTVSAPHEPAASGAPAYELSPEAHAFALLLAQARYAAYLQARQSAGDPVSPLHVDRPSSAAPAMGADLRDSRPGSDRVPAGAMVLEACEASSGDSKFALTRARAEEKT